MLARLGQTRPSLVELDQQLAKIGQCGVKSGKNRRAKAEIVRNMPKVAEGRQISVNYSATLAQLLGEFWGGSRISLDSPRLFSRTTGGETVRPMSDKLTGPMGKVTNDDK